MSSVLEPPEDSEMSSTSTETRKRRKVTIRAKKGKKALLFECCGSWGDTMIDMLRNEGEAMGRIDCGVPFSRRFIGSSEDNIASIRESAMPFDDQKTQGRV